MSASKSVSPEAVETSTQRMLLQFEIEQFLYREARLLDERCFDEWLTLLSDDIHYWMPIRRTVTRDNIDLEFTKPGGMSYFDDNKTDLVLRIEKLATGFSWAEDPPSRTRHFVSNVEITALAGDEVTVNVAFHLYRSRLESLTDHFVGRREDTFRRVEGVLRLCRRHIFCDHTIVRATNLSVLF